MAVPTQHQHASHKKCTSASCSSRSKIWKAIQLAIATDDKKGLAAMFQDQDRIVHFKTVLLKERNINDASALPPSHKHQILQFDKPIRPEAFAKFGNSVTDLNALQVALFRQREGIACQLLHFLRQNATPSELQAFIGHVWGKGNSSLHLACFHRMPRLVQMLLDMGADPNATNARDLTPADCCKDPGCLAALKKVAADSPELPPVIARRASATLPPPPTRVAAVSLKRQASVPGLKLARPAVEKKPTPATAPKSPTKRSILPPPAKAPAKSDAATASLLHGNRARHQGNVKPVLAKRQSSGLKPTPETERPVTQAPADPSAAAQQQQQQQQQQHQQKQQQKQAATAPTVTADPIKERRLQISARLPQQPSNHDASPPLLPSTDGVATADDALPPPPTEATPPPHPTPSSPSPALGLQAGGKQPFNHPPNISDGLQPPSSALTSAVKHANDGPPLEMSTAKAQEDSPGSIATTTTTTTTTTTVPEASHDTTRAGQSTLEPDDPSGAAAQTDLALAIQHLVSVFTAKGILEQSTKQWTAMALSMDAADAHRQYASHQSCSAGVMHSLTGDSQVARGQIAVL